MVSRLLAKRQEIGLVMENLYRYLGLSRQGHQQRMRRRQAEWSMMTSVESQVARYRTDWDRRAGSRSLYHNLDIKNQFGIGVTKFEQLMSTYGLTLAPLRIRVVTTQSVLQSWNYKNQTNGLSINGINQAVAGDLTYVDLGRLRFYLFGLTDLYSARLVGLWVSDRMRASDAKHALDDWIQLRGFTSLRDCIHHSDGGSQYFSQVYLDQLRDHHIRISVARNCLQNGYAEQRNSFIKHHLIPTMRLQNLKAFQSQLRQIDYFYNYKRKQKGLGWRSPVDFEEYTQKLALQDRPVKILHNFD